MIERLEKEMELLRTYDGEIEFREEGQWMLIRGFSAPTEPVWTPAIFDVCFQIPAGYPGAPPYGFYVPRGIRCAGNPPHGNYNATPPSSPPFEGEWGFFSWSHDSSWRPTTDLQTGSNLSNFVHSFTDRLRQGV